MRTLSDNDAATVERAVSTLRRMLPAGASPRAVNALRLLAVISGKLQRQREKQEKTINRQSNKQTGTR